jgi:hypothetical protein
MKYFTIMFLMLSSLSYKSFTDEIYYVDLFDDSRLISTSGDYIAAPDGYWFGSSLQDEITILQRFTSQGDIERFRVNSKLERIDPANIMVLIGIGSEFLIIEENDLQGVVDLDFQTIINPQYEFLDRKGDFFLGTKNNQFFLHDLNGALVFSTDLLNDPSLNREDIDFGDDGSIRIEVISDDFRVTTKYLDPYGNEIISWFSGAGRNFSNGFAVIEEFPSKDLYYINSRGEKLIIPDADYLQDFSEGLAGVRINNKMGYVNSDGVMIIEPIYDYVTPFQNGYAFVTQNEPNKDGNLRIGAYPGWTRKGAYAVIDKAGNLLTKFMFFGVKRILPGGVARALIYEEEIGRFRDALVDINDQQNVFSKTENSISNVFGFVIIE